MSDVVTFEYRYKQELESVVATTGKLCPPEAAREVGCTAYRYVHAPLSEKSFVPQGLTDPKRVLAASAHNIKCSLLGLSMFTSESSARARYGSLKRNMPRIGKKLGSHLARGVLREEDGVATGANVSGHFDFFEYIDGAVSTRFEVVGEL